MNTFDLPRLALSVRQPWAYGLAMGWKPVENRSWRVITPQRRHVGPFCIHASKGMTRAEYEDGAELFEELGFPCPPPAELQRGGIIAVAHAGGIVKTFDSPWFFGPKAIVVTDAAPVVFVPCAGALDFFAWKQGGTIEPAKPWMWKVAPAPASPQGALL